jgi:ABC-2 type transport system ATP-binding protein
VIRARGLVKRYGRTWALDELDLDVPAGAIYGLIGQNGAGKTTAIRALATLLAPDEGEIEVAGADAIRSPTEVRRLVGYMPDFFGVYDDLKVGEYLEFYAALYGLRTSEAQTLRDSLLDLVDLGNKRDDYVEALSRGMQQRLCLARALIHDPQVLLLDEPASGLDPIARVEMREVLQELGKMGKTVIISSHILSELADVCTHVGMMASGRMVREGTVLEVLWAAERPGFILHVLRDPAEAMRVLESMPGVGAVAVVSGGIRFHCEGGAEGASAVLAALVTAGIPVSGLTEIETSLESTFLELTRAGAE